MLVDVFIRRLISTPSWHRHLKRAFGADMVSVLQWPTPNVECEKPAAGDSGVVTMRAFPKEVYGWYKSASLHTGKKKIPFRVWVFLACAILAPLLGWYAFSNFSGALSKRDATVSKLAGKDPAHMSPAANVRPPGQPAAERRVLSPAEYAQSFQPRIAGLAHTAPRYDELDRPAQFPEPAACLDGTKPGSGKRTCTCWSQQATVLQVPADLCRQIAAGGFFDDTLQPPRQQDSRPLQASQPFPPPLATAEPSSLALMASSPVLPPPEIRSTVQRDGEILKQMRKRSYIQ
jgi:zona occludens toxin